MPVARAVPRVTTASSIPSAAQAAKISQPPARPRTRSHADGQATSASSAAAIAKLDTTPSA